MDYLCELGRRITQSTDDHRESAVLFQRLSVFIQRYNAVPVFGTFTPRPLRTKCSRFSISSFQPSECILLRAMKNINNPIQSITIFRTAETLLAAFCFSTHFSLFLYIDAIYRINLKNTPQLRTDFFYYSTLVSERKSYKILNGEE